MSFFSFLSNFKSFKRYISDIEIKAQHNFAEQLRIHSQEIELEQLELEQKFQWSNNPEIFFKIWDEETWDDDPLDSRLPHTFAYIDNQNIPSFACYELLQKLQGYLRSQEIQCRMMILDQLILYPHLVLDVQNRRKLTKRWVLVIDGVQSYHSFFAFMSKIKCVCLPHNGSVLKNLTE